MRKGSFLLRNTIIVCTVMTVFILMFPLSTYSQENMWSYDGPEFKAIHSLVISSQDTEYMYAGTDQGVYKVLRSLAPPFMLFWWPAGLDGYKIKTLARSEEFPQTLYAGTSSWELFKTVNGGELWTPLQSPANIHTLALVPQDDSKVYALSATPGGVYRSVNGGNNWVQINNGITNNWFLCIAVNPQNPEILYIGAGNNAGVFKSPDGGNRWFAVSNGLPSRSIFSLVIDPASPGTLYAGTSGEGVYKTTDSGMNWWPVNTGLSISYVNKLAIHPGDTSIIYAGAGNYPGDYGAAWSTNGGSTWTDVNPGWMGDGYITALVVEPEVPSFVDIVYAGTGRIGSVYRSALPYFSFFPQVGGLQNPEVRVVAVEPLQSFSSRTNYAVYACTGNGLFKRFNNAQDTSLRWIRLDTPDFIPDTELTTLVIGHMNTELIYTSAGGTVLYRSTDGGIGWDYLQTPMSVSKLAIDPQNDSILYMIGGGLGNIYKTINGGNTWQLINTGLNPNTLYRQIVVDPLNPSTLYLCSMDSQNGGIYKTVDRGEHWYLLNEGGLPQGGVFLIAVDPVNSDNVYIVLNLFYSGIYKSTNGGKTWTNYTNGLENTILNQLVVDPGNPDTLYAGDGGYGDHLFYTSTDGGQNWVALDEGIAGWLDVVECMDVDPRNGSTIYAGTMHNNLWRYPMTSQ